jgi:hypothetical protein
MVKSFLLLCLMLNGGRYASGRILSASIMGGLFAKSYATLGILELMEALEFFPAEVTLTLTEWVTS